MEQTVRFSLNFSLDKEDLLIDTELLSLFRLLADRPRTLLQLLQRYGSAHGVFERGGADELLQYGVDRLLIDTSLKQFQRQVEKDVEWLQSCRRHLISITDKHYPELLREIHDAPVLLFARGNLAAIKSPRIAMVGSRNPTRLGISTAHRLAGELSMAGLTVVSGMALGVDAACHRGALDVGGKTIAVFGTGCDLVYPARHRKLADQIAEQGLLLSEFPLGTRSVAWNFPRRNRVVTGLCLGTIVVEAALKSGSLISARYALEQGREVFSVPGAINSRQSHGCHQLIRDGATLVENLDDVLAQLSFLAPRAAAKPIRPVPSEPLQHVMNVLDSQPQGVDLIAGSVGLPIEVVISALVELEILGFVAQEKGGYVRS